MTPTNKSSTSTIKAKSTSETSTGAADRPLLPQWGIRALATVVIVAGSVLPFLPQDHWSRTAVLAVISIGAGFGIMSNGVFR